MKHPTPAPTAQHTNPVEREAREMGFTPDAAQLLGRLAYESEAPITRAPWHVNAILNNRIVGDASAPQFDKLQICNSNATVATVYRRQDARLIAAAPDLLASLRALVNGRVRISDKANDMLSEHDPNVILARQAIARASQPYPKSSRP